jgi:branched-chain amino acid transport system permease protein
MNLQKFLQKSWLVLFLGALVFPVFAPEYYVELAFNVGIYIILAQSLNLIIGFAGLLNLGQAAFFGVGAYTYGILWKFFQVPFFVAFPFSILSAALTGLLVGLPVLRVRHDYIAIVTLGFGEIIKLILNNWTDLTDGPNGIYGMASPQIFGWVVRSRVGYYYLVLVLVCLVVFFMYRLENSRLGRAWIAIREDEISASSLGIKTNRLKLLAFTLGAGLAGMAGCVLAAKHRFISPAGFGFYESIILLCMVTIGGIGNIPGVMLGAAVLYVVPEILREFSDFRMITVGLAMIALMLFRPEGVLGKEKRKTIWIQTGKILKNRSAP